MLHTNTHFEEAVAAAVGRIEAKTDAEIVVVAAERSGTYRDVAMIGAAVFSFSLLLVILFSPVEWHPLLAAFDLAIAFPGLTWVLNRRFYLRRVASVARRRAQVRVAAESEFFREAVHGTPNRSGVLVYVSALEGIVEVLPDVGITGRIAPGELVPAIAAFSHDDLEHFLRGLEALGEVLARGVPHTEGSDAIDLPNAPRIRR